LWYQEEEMPSFPQVALVLASALLASPPPITKSTGAKMCVLTQSDFRAVGLSVNARPSADIEQDGDSAYCVYRGKSGAAGGVELDVFYPAGSTPRDVQQTFQTVSNADPDAQYEPHDVSGADRAVFSLTVPQDGNAPFAANVVQRGDLVFSISVPNGPDAKKQLQHLGEIVLVRLAK
jgi:hypothetical protein